MKVADLAQHLTDLGRLLEVAGAKGVAKDLATIAAGLRPFQERTLPDFVEFLRKAHEYDTKGVLLPPKKEKPGPKTKLDPMQVAQRVRQLYDDAGQRPVPPEQMETELQALASLNKDGLLRVAGTLELVILKSKKVDEIRGMIRDKVLDRRASSQRADMTARPTTASNEAPTPYG